MKYVVYVDCSIDNVPCKIINIKSKLNADKIKKIINECSDRFTVTVKKYDDNFHNGMFYNLEDAILEIVNMKFEYVTEKRDFIDNFDRVEDGILSHDKILNKTIIIKDGIAYYKTTKCENHKVKYIVPNTSNNDDIVMEEL